MKSLCGYVFVVGTIIAAQSSLSIAGATGLVHSPSLKTASQVIATTTSPGAAAVIELGKMGEPKTVFWQLLIRKPGSTQWAPSDTTMGVAVNVGLSLSGNNPPGEIGVGIEATNLLAYSPILTSPLKQTKALSWSHVLAPGRLKSGLTVNATYGAKQVALVQKNHTQYVDLFSTSTSRPIVAATTKELSSKHPQCALTNLSALDVVTNTIVIGGSCTHGHNVALFALHDGNISTVSQSLPAECTATPNTVVSLSSADTNGRVGILTPSALCIGTFSTGMTKVVLYGSPLEKKGLQVQSLSDLSTTPAVIYAANGVAKTQAAILPANHQTRWQLLPSLPAYTQTVAQGNNGSVEAIAGQKTAVSVYLLTQANAWKKIQNIHFHLAYGNMA
jgi:hypothetical protein